MSVATTGAHVQGHAGGKSTACRRHRPSASGRVLPPRHKPPRRPSCPACSKYLWEAAVETYRVEHPNYNLNMDADERDEEGLFISAVLCSNETALANDPCATPLKARRCCSCATGGAELLPRRRKSPPRRAAPAVQPSKEDLAKANVTVYEVCVPAGPLPSWLPPRRCRPVRAPCCCRARSRSGRINDVSSMSTACIPTTAAAGEELHYAYGPEYWDLLDRTTLDAGLRRLLRQEREQRVELERRLKALELGQAGSGCTMQ